MRNCRNPVLMSPEAKQCKGMLLSWGTMGRVQGINKAVWLFLVALWPNTLVFLKSAWYFYSKVRMKAKRREKQKKEEKSRKWTKQMILSAYILWGEESLWHSRFWDWHKAAWKRQSLPSKQKSQGIQTSLLCQSWEVWEGCWEFRFQIYFLDNESKNEYE